MEEDGTDVLADDSGDRMVDMGMNIEYSETIAAKKGPK